MWRTWPVLPPLLPHLSQVWSAPSPPLSKLRVLCDSSSLSMLFLLNSIFITNILCFLKAGSDTRSLPVQCHTTSKRQSQDQSLSTNSWRRPPCWAHRPKTVPNSRAGYSASLHKTMERSQGRAGVAASLAFPMIITKTLGKLEATSGSSQDSNLFAQSSHYRGCQHNSPHFSLPPHHQPQPCFSHSSLYTRHSCSDFLTELSGSKRLTSKRRCSGPPRHFQHSEQFSLNSLSQN